MCLICLQTCSTKINSFTSPNSIKFHQCEAFDGCLSSIYTDLRILCDTNMKKIEHPAQIKRYTKIEQKTNTDIQMKLLALSELLIRGKEAIPDIFDDYMTEIKNIYDIVDLIYEASIH